ncbi:MAG: DUF1510 family protein [Alkalicoccus sp.]|nr:MAG: DUF1510 family protein [Alkalicoccus sp.]
MKAGKGGYNKVSNNIPQRTGQKKNRKLNTVLNLSIGMVALLIVVVSIGLIIGGGSDETATDGTENISVNNSSDTGTNNSDNSFNNNLNAGREDVENNSGNSENNSNEENNENNDNNGNNENNENNDNNGNNENNENNETNENNEAPEDGEWEPIGTSQENFSLSFDRGGQNWNEMIEAISYATGLPSNEDELNVHRLENGGDQYSAVGTVSASDGDRDRPYRVHLEWVEDEGWKPVSVERLNSNPY